MKHSRFLLIALTASIASIGAVKPFSEYPRSDCGVLIKKYNNASIWDNGRVRFRIEADSACAGRPGRALELENVRLTIEAGTQHVASLYSATGVISQRQGKLIMGEIYGPTDSPLIPASPTLLVDMMNHLVRSPTGVYLDFKDFSAKSE